MGINFCIGAIYFINVNKLNYTILQYIDKYTK